MALCDELTHVHTRTASEQWHSISCAMSRTSHRAYMPHAPLALALLLVCASFLLSIDAAALPASCLLPSQAHVLMRFDLTAQKKSIKMETVQETLKVLEELQGPVKRGHSTKFNRAVDMLTLTRRTLTAI
jgi:hypothetical protein